MRYLVSYRRRYMDKDTIEPEEYGGKHNAEYYATMIFNRLQLDRVRVIEVDPETQEVGVVYLQERNCKHLNIQQEFDVRNGALSKRCMDCREPILELAPKEPICMKSE